MTLPNFDYLNQNTSLPDFSFLKEDNQPGVFSYLGNLSKNILGLSTQHALPNSSLAAITNLVWGHSPQDLAQLQQIKQNLIDANVKSGEAWDKVKEDLSPKNFFSKMSEIHDMGSASEMIGGLPMALASTVGSPMEALTGLGLGKEGAPILNPEERAAKIKETAAIVVSTAVGGFSRLAITSALERSALGGVSAEVAGSVLGQETNMGLNILSKGGKIGQLGRDILKGSVEAGSAGVAFGAVSQANTENQLSGMLTGLLFAPLGVATEMLGTVIKGGDNISRVQKAAGDLFNLRQLQYSPDKSLFELTKSLESIATSDDLAMAVVNGKLALGDSHVIIQGTEKTRTELRMATPDALLNIGVIEGPDGNMLFWNRDTNILTPKDNDVFKKTGYLPNEVVSYKGRNYLFGGESTWTEHLEATSKMDMASSKSYAEKTHIGLIDPVTTKRIVANVSEISRNSVFDLENGKVFIDSPVTLKGKLLAVNKAKPQGLSGGPGNYNINMGDIINPYQSHNTLALDNAVTGSPTAFIGMRQSRGQQIIGNGKFYALSPEHLLNYTPSKYEGYSSEIVTNPDTGPFKLGITSTAPGRQTIPGILDAQLSVNRVTFENPFVFNGKHYSFSRDVSEFYNKYVKESQAGKFPFESAVSGAGIQWGKIFTPSEMAGIREARKLEQKPIGIGTQKYLDAKEQSKILAKASDDHAFGRITDQEYAKIQLEVNTSYMGSPAGKTHSESHYAIIDRIVAKAMKRNGYDGFIYRSGGIHNSEVVDILERGVFNRKDQVVKMEGRSSNVLDSEKFVDKLYDEFKSKDIAGHISWDELKHRDKVIDANGDTWTVDKEYHPGFTNKNGSQNYGEKDLAKVGSPQFDSILNTQGKEPLGFDNAFDQFTKSKGFLPEELPALRRSFEIRINKEILESLPIEERPLFNRLKQEITESGQRLFNNGTENLRSSALSNNMYFDQADAGVIHLRDVDSNKSLGTFHSVQDAQEFISKSGQVKGTNLDGNANIPPSASAPAGIPDNLGPLNPPPSGWLEKKYALWTTRLSFATANPTLFKNWDTLFGSNLHSTVFNLVDKAAKLTDGKKIVWLQKLKTADNTLGKATVAEREHVFNWMETRSIQEHEQFGGAGRKPLSPIEIALGKQIQNADLTNMYRYKNAMRSVDINTPEGMAMDAQLQKQFNITPNETNALMLLGIAEKNQVQKVSIGSAVHYARLLQNPELALTRAEYAKKFNLSPKQLETARLLDRYFDDLADVAGISKDKVLFNYITHARLYENGSLPDAIAKYALDKPTEEFYAALNRTGEINVYERDPIRAALNYTNKLFDTLYLAPEINKARENLKLELAKLPAGSGLKVERDANRYLRDVRHIPAEGDKYADAAVNHLKGNLGLNIEKGTSRKWVNAINEVFTVAAQGARPWAGIRDFYSNTSKYFVKWGAKDTAEMLQFGGNANLDNLRQSGLIENYTQLGLNSAVDDTADALSHTGNRLKGTIDKTAHKALVLSGQQYVNDMARAGAFLVTRNKVAIMLRKLHSKEFGDMAKPETFSKAYNSIQLERYSPAVFQEFDRMIKSNKTEEAANYLGNQNIQETFGNYANANHPSGWNNNFGRLVGKFGQWSINHRDYIVSLASRGTREQRLQALGRLAITESAVAGAATLLGVNLSNFYSIPGMYFKGGPAGDLFYTAYNAMFGKGMEQESAIRKVQQLLPYDQVNEKFKGSIIVPFSFALTDLVEGLEMSQSGDMLGGLARMGGVRPQSDAYSPSMWEEQIGNIVSGR